MWTAARGRFGLLYPLFCCFFTLSPCFIVDGWQMSPLLAIWAFGAVARWFFHDRQIVTDSIVFAIVYAILTRGELKDTIVGRWEGLDMSVVAAWWVLISYFAIPLAALALLLRWRAYRKPTISKFPDDISAWTLQYPKTRIFPSQIKHARMFPKRHAFEYTYLQCGFPVIPGGVMADGTDVGSGDDLQIGSWWLRIRAEDYLSRGNGALGFYGKLQSYLREQHISDTEWSYAYLVTAPRVMGYAFNPVSFWYIYDADHQLTRMIVEVNNTFGERRMYLLDGSNVTASTPQSTNTEASGPDLPLGAKSRFSDIWMKDFHVSPFNSRNGSYVLRALNPFPYATYESPVIDNTITLISSKDYAKLVARLNSTGKALDPDQLGMFAVIRFVLNWWWVGLVIFPRILKEGCTLFLRQKLRIWLRPEVLATCVGRIPTSTELELSKVFKDYLLLLVQQSQESFSITLHTAIPDQPTIKIATTHHVGPEQQMRELEIRVLTPAFYSRFVHYAYTSEAFDRECVFTDEKNRTLWISRPELLPLLLNKPTVLEASQWPLVERGYLDEMRWKFLTRLRCAPALPAYSVSTPSRTEFTMEDVRSLPFSELDQFVRASRGCSWASEYRRTVTKLFLAQRFGFGFSKVIGLLDLLARVLFCSLGAFQLVAWRAQPKHADIDGCSTEMFRDGTLSACLRCLGEVHGEWWWLIGSTVSISACHIYGLLKGYN